jgi:uncharacterized membrane protein YkvA (DUF1232 family)
MSNPTPSLPAPPGNIVRQTIFRARLIWRLIRDPRIHWMSKLIPIAGLAYVLFPFDFLPDLAPVVGQIDDVGIFVGSLWLFMELCPDDIVKEHWDDLASVTVKGTWKEEEKDKLAEKAGESTKKPE